MKIFEKFRRIIREQVHAGQYFDYHPTDFHNPSTSQSASEHVRDLSALSLVMDKARGAIPAIRTILPILAAGCSLITAIAFSVTIILLGRYLFHSESIVELIVFSFLPALLFGASCAHILGNYFIFALTGLDDQERRSLALHLPWNKNPKNWPKYFRRWLYCGDWLVDNFSGDILPYVRAFITGDAPKHIDEELDLWADFFANSNHAHKIEIGHSIRELACVESLPSWTRDITPGMDLPDLERYLGPAGHTWAVNLLRRAAARKKVFGKIDFTGTLSETRFEFHYCRFENGREGLIIIIRPDAISYRQYEDTFSDVA